MHKNSATSHPHPMIRLWRIVRPIRVRLMLGLVCAIGSAVLGLMIPQVLERLVNSDLVQGGTATAVWTAGATVLVLGIFEALLLFLRRVFALVPATAIERDMRTDLYDQIQDMPVAFHDQWSSGQLLSRAMSDTNLIRRWIAFGVIMGVTTAVTTIVGIALLIRASWILALVFIAAAIPIGIFSFRFNRQFSTLSRLSQDQNGDLATTIEQSVQGIRVLKAFGRGPTALEQFTLQADELRGTEVKKATAIARFDMLMYGLPEIATSISLLLGIYLTAHGHMNLGQLSAYFVTAVLVTGPVRMLGQLFGMLINTNTALDRYFEVMDAPNTIADPETPTLDPGHTFSGRLALHDVHFRYSDSPAHMPDLLDGVSLEVEPGETMALVGITGSGKSTLLQLVPRLYDVTSGQVTIDGHDVRDIPLDTLHRITAFAFEDATLFSDSVRDNVLLGAPGYERTVGTVEFADRLFGSDGTVPPVTRTSMRTAELDRALELALDTADARYAYDLPEGIETHIGEEGMSLSGGQRQRLALARAIAAKPTVLLLDDPLSALDTKTEERVTERLREVLSHTTTLIVAHRTSTVALADRVALLEDGRITAVGTHTQLMASSERYRYVIANQEEEARGNRNLTRVATETGSLEVAEIREAVDEKGGAQ